MQTLIGKIILIAAICVLANPAIAQSTDPTWLQELESQLISEKNCEPEFYVSAREGKLAGRVYYEARVQCRDGRRFDANRLNPDLYFTITPCATTVC